MLGNSIKINKKERKCLENVVITGSSDFTRSLSLNKINWQLVAVANACNISIWKLKAGGSGFPGQLQLHKDLQDSLNTWNLA